MTGFSSQVHAFAVWYHEQILWIGEATGGSDTDLHVHAGLALWLLASLALRARLGQIAPLLLAMVGALANELLDWVVAGRLMNDAASDLFATLFWPSMVTLVGAILRLARRPRRPHPGEHVVDRSPLLIATDGNAIGNTH